MAAFHILMELRKCLGIAMKWLNKMLANMLLLVLRQLGGVAVVHCQQSMLNEDFS